MFEAYFRTLRQSQGQSIVRTVWLYMMKSGQGTGALQKSHVATNCAKSPLNAVSSFGDISKTKKTNLISRRCQRVGYISKFTS